MRKDFALIISLLSLFGLNFLQAQNIRIIPQPQEVKTGQGTVIINSNTRILSSAESKSTAVYLQKQMEDILGNPIKISGPGRHAKGTIRFILDKSLKKEAYELEVSKKGIQIRASGSAGWFYGVQSFIQLFPALQGSEESLSDVEIPVASIKDAPRFSWRAFMLDEARYFKGPDQVKMLLDEMALLKMNVFHWHLTDDQGWRIEIKKYPLLTEIGSKRKSSQIGPLKWKSPIQSGEPHEGFYTQEEIKEIVKYAQERHISIVPEIEMPGHSTAAIASYSWLGTAKQKIQIPIRFTSLDVYDVSDPEVYRFLTDVLDEVMDLFPSKVIHIGGDEVNYNHWKNSESVQKYMKEKELATPADLQIFFTNSISGYLQTKGRRMMGWNEILGHKIHEYQDTADTKSSQKLAGKSIIHFWKGDLKLLALAAGNGYDIVNSLHSSTYLDYDYNSIPLSKAYDFDPIPADLDPQYHDKVIGTGCQMWGEWIPFKGQMHFQVFPRIAAYAEVGWTEKENKDFESFKEALRKLQKHWKAKGIWYAPDNSAEK